MIKLSDQQLICQYFNGDKQSLEFLISRYLKIVYALAYNYAKNTQDAEDITQEVFVKVYKHLKRFDRSRNFKTWLMAIARHEAVDFYRRKKVAIFSSIDEFYENLIVDSSPLADELIDNSILDQELKKAINKLAPKHQSVISLYHQDGFNFKAIAKLSGESVNTIKSRYRRAIFKLKKLLVS